GFVGAVAVADDRSGEVAQHFGRSLRRPAVENSITDRVRRNDRPHLPTLPGTTLLLVLLAHETPVRLVRTDHRLAEHVSMEPLVRRLQELPERVELIPQRLRVYFQPFALHHPDLTLERHVVRVLRHGNVDGEVHRVTRAIEELERTGSCLDTRAAAAAVLLALVLLQHEASFEDVDLLRFFVLAAPLREPAAASLADLVSFVGKMDLFDVRKPRLLASSVPRLLLRCVCGLALRGQRTLLA